MGDSFGADSVKGAMTAFSQVNGAPLFVEKFDREKPDFTAVAKSVTATSPQAILFLGSGKAVVDGVKAIRATGSRAQIVTLSNNASDGFIKSLGDDAAGTIVTQVFPYERSLANLMVKEARQFERNATGQDRVTPAMLEGFAGAKVLVEGLRRCGAHVTRERLRDSLETLHRFDIGGLEVSFNAASHLARLHRPVHHRQGRQIPALKGDAGRARVGTPLTLSMVTTVIPRGRARLAARAPLAPRRPRASTDPSGARWGSRSPTPAPRRAPRAPLVCALA